MYRYQYVWKCSLLLYPMDRCRSALGGARAQLEHSWQMLFSAACAAADPEDPATCGISSIWNSWNNGWRFTTTLFKSWPDKTVLSG